MNSIFDRKRVVRRAATFVVRLFALAVVLAPVSCTGGPESKGSGNTNWLECRSDVECGALACQCGVCTPRCSGHLECSLPPGKMCVHPGPQPLLDSGADAGRPEASLSGRVDAGTRDAIGRDAPEPVVEADVVDTSAPIFAGLASAELAPRPFEVVDPGREWRLSDASFARLEWAPASDDVTPASAIVYDVFAGKSPGAVDFTRPLVRSAAGALTVDVGPLDSMATYTFVVRAADAAGNREENPLERSVDTLVGFDHDVQPIFDAHCVDGGCHAHATPFFTPPQGLALDASYAYRDLLGRPARGGYLYGRPEMPYVDTSSTNVEDSELWLKVQPVQPQGAGAPMPPTGYPELEARHRETLRRWILQEKFYRLCELPELAPPGAACPTAAAPIANGDFESGATGWFGSGRVVDDGTGNHAFRLQEMDGCGMSQSSTAIRVPDVAPALYFRSRGTPPEAEVSLFAGSCSLTTSTVHPASDTAYTSSSLCLRGCAGRTVTLDVFFVVLGQCDPSNPTRHMLIDDVEIVSDPACAETTDAGAD